MLTAWLFIGMAFAAPEIILVENTPWLKRFMKRDPRIEFFASIPFNLALGAVMAIPAGVNIAIGGIFAAGMTTMWYKADPLVKYRVVKTKVQHTAQVVRDVKAQVKTLWTIIRIPLMPFIVILRILTAVRTKIDQPERSEGYSAAG